jgi:hypothetical protein
MLSMHMPWLLATLCVIQTGRVAESQDVQRFSVMLCPYVVCCCLLTITLPVPAGTGTILQYPISKGTMASYPTKKVNERIIPGTCTAAKDKGHKQSQQTLNFFNDDDSL